MWNNLKSMVDSSTYVTTDNHASYTGLENMFHTIHSVIFKCFSAIESQTDCWYRPLALGRPMQICSTQAICGKFITHIKREKRVNWYHHCTAFYAFYVLREVIFKPLHSHFFVLCFIPFYYFVRFIFLFFWTLLFFFGFWFFVNFDHFKHKILCTICTINLLVFQCGDLPLKL